MAYLNGACHASYGTIQQLLRETCGVAIASGTLVQLCHKVSRSLQPAYDSLQQQIPRQSSVHIDETSHRENGKLLWTWVFRAPEFTLLHIDLTRGAKVLDQILGTESCGTLLSDYFSAYRHYLKMHPRADAQFCLAHLVRDVNVKFLETVAEPGANASGRRLPPAGNMAATCSPSCKNPSSPTSPTPRRPPSSRLENSPPHSHAKTLPALRA